MAGGDRGGEDHRDRSQAGRGGPPPSVLQMALEYYRRGWSIIPIASATKKPPKGFRWSKYQKTRPTEDELREWFADRDDLGLAVIFGDVSGGLVCRDFDTMAGYERWAAIVWHAERLRCAIPVRALPVHPTEQFACPTFFAWRAYPCAPWESAPKSRECIPCSFDLFA